MVAFTKKEQFFPCKSHTKLLPLRTGCYGCAAAAENVYLQRGAKHVGKFLPPGLFDPEGRGSPQTIMQPWKVAYL